MDSRKYIGINVHKESISIAVRNGAGKIITECVIETKASMILDFIDGLRRDLQLTFEEGTSAAWLYDLWTPCDETSGVRSARECFQEGRQPERQDRRAPVGRAAAAPSASFSASSTPLE